MCLILFAYKVHPQYPLIVAANRDEAYARETLALDYWSDYPHVLAGRDQELMGTWLGVNKQGAFAAVTNYREGVARSAQQLSRGALGADFLCQMPNINDYLQRLSQRDALYAGYNLLIGNVEQLYYYSNRQHQIQCLSPGYYGLANHLLNTDWPKVQRGKQELQRITSQEFELNDLLQLLTDETPANPEQLPKQYQGNPHPDLGLEKALSPIHIKTPTYGTRASTALTIDKNGVINFAEKDHTPGQSRQLRQFEFHNSDS